MYTFVPKVRTEDHKPRGDKPSMQIIDHRQRNNRVVSRSLPNEASALEIVMDQRNELFDNELGYKRRIKELEADAKDMAAALEEAATENRSLKNNMNRGPTRADVKRLNDEKKGLQNVIEKLAEENFELNELLNRVAKRSEEEWREVFENVRRRQEERYSVIGPFVSRVGGLKKRTVTMNDGPEMNKDFYDSHLSKIEKDTQSLLHRLKQLKREKRVIDYSLVTGQRKCMINYKEFKEVGATMNRDLNKFSTQLEKLSDKHVGMIDSLQEYRGLCDIAVQTEEEEKPVPEIIEVSNIKKNSKKRAVAKLPPIQASNKTTAVVPPVDSDITLPPIIKDNLLERQRTMIKTTDTSTKASNVNINTNRSTTSNSGEESNKKNTNTNGKRSPIKNASPLSNRSKKSNESKASSSSVPESPKKKTEPNKKDNGVTTSRVITKSPQETVKTDRILKSNTNKQDSPKGLSKDDKDSKKKQDLVSGKEKQNSPSGSRKVNKETNKGKQTLESTKESGGTNMAKMVINAKLEKAPHR